MSETQRATLVGLTRRFLPRDSTPRFEGRLPAHDETEEARSSGASGASRGTAQIESESVTDDNALRLPRRRRTLRGMAVSRGTEFTFSTAWTRIWFRRNLTKTAVDYFDDGAHIPDRKMRANILFVFKWC